MHELSTFFSSFFSTSFSTSFSRWHLLRPQWLWLLVPVVLLVLTLLRQQQRNSRWRDVIDTALQPYLLEQGAATGAVKPFAIVALVWLLAILCLAGPSCSQRATPTQARQDAVVILLDLSLSMYANDVTPSRLVRAKHAISDLLAHRKDGRTALIVYAGDAHVVTPLTDDTSAIENLLPQLEPSIMPVPGSNIADALALTHRLLRNAETTQARVLVITDEIDQVEDVSNADRSGMTISVLGVGTPEGAPIPLDFAGRTGELLKDGQGTAVIARLDATQLAAAARAGGGRYRTAQLTNDDAEVLLGEGSLDIAAADALHANAQRKFQLWSDDGYWLLLLIAPLAALAFRRGLIAGVLLTCVIASVPRPATAMSWRDLWQRADQQGMSALNAGAADRAAKYFTTPQWRAIALYRGNHYTAAASLFGADPNADGYYNRGNALARAGNLPGALAAYDRALALAPKHADAAFNRELIKRLAQQQKNAPQPQRGAQQHGSQQRQGGAQSAHQNPQHNEQNPQQNAQVRADQDRRGTAQAQPGERPADALPSSSAHRQAPPRAPSARADQQLAMSAAQRAAQERQEEKQRADEQWLRRVPDDPGGLLRRKFNSESGERFLDRRGPTGTDKIW